MFLHIKKANLHKISLVHLILYLYLWHYKYIKHKMSHLKIKNIYICKIQICILPLNPCPIITHNIVKGDTPDLLLQTVNQANNYNLRNANNFTIPWYHLTLFQNSFFPATIHLWNNLPQYIRDSPSNCILKSRLKTYYNNPVKPPKYFSFGSRLASILHTRLRQNCSSLKCDLFRSDRFLLL